MGAASLQAVATRLVRKNGRDVSLVRLSRRAKDPSKPHRGTSEIEEAKITVKAFIADYAEDDIDGDAIRRGDQRALIEVNLETAGDINSATDFTKFDRLIDNGREWRIVTIGPVQLGSTDLVFKAQLRA